MNNSGFAFDPDVFLSHVSTLSGVYQMRDQNGTVLYVGKAKNLRQRLSHYFQKTGLSVKTRALMRAVYDIQTTSMPTEAEALLLENNLIKQYQPKFNILLRDDKSYPYICLSQHDFPRLLLYRGARKNGDFFGPYPNVQSAHHALAILQKVFRLRPCLDSFFKNRSRPCLQYQIKRCYAPCVGKISAEMYAQTVQHARDFLTGNSEHLLQTLTEHMLQASAAQQYERAAIVRDQISELRTIQQKQSMVVDAANVDVLAVATAYGKACVQVLFFRDGHSVTSQAFFPKLPELLPAGAILQAFIGQFYHQRPVPSQIVLSEALPDMDAVSEFLSQMSAHTVTLTTQPRAIRKKWLRMTQENARLNLRLHLAQKLSMHERFKALAQAFDWQKMPQRLECVDISHMQGEYTVASCVVFDRRGAVKSDYRRYKINGITGGDDYAAMKQVIKRRFARLKKGEGVMPDVFFVDGGRGQLQQAIAVFEEMQIEGVQLIGVAKGEGRKAGLEQFWFPHENHPRTLPADSQAMQLIIHIRDEAHRFAISAHRRGRDKKVRVSLLEEIPNIGRKRRQALLQHFGNLSGLMQASPEDITRVPGISVKLAAQIYAALHQGE